MDLDTYQERAWRTAVYPHAGEGQWTGLAYAGLGATGEAGEIANKIRKMARDDLGELTAARRDAIMSDVGGTLWYLAAVAQELGTTLSVIAERNIGELSSRAERGGEQ
jgi:NTP pyrophosphatase (non-canonical NTP hydrolase)